MPQDQQQWITTIISFGVLALVLILRMRRARQVRPLKVGRLWILPAFYSVVVTLLYMAHPPVGMVWIYALGALAIGLLAGWWRGKLMIIHVDPQTHEVSQQGSVLAMAVIVVLVVVRIAARNVMASTSGNDPAFILAMTDALLALGLGFVAAQSLEIWMRARELLAAAWSAS